MTVPGSFGIDCARQLRGRIEMKTGHTVEILGLYATECCNAELILDFGDVFPLCPQCLQGCSWDMEEELFTTAELERLNSLAA